MKNILEYETFLEGYDLSDVGGVVGRRKDNPSTLLKKKREDFKNKYKDELELIPSSSIADATHALIIRDKHDDLHIIYVSGTRELNKAQKMLKEKFSKFTIETEKM